MIETDVLQEQFTKAINTPGYSIVIYDDNVNTFEHVMRCLVCYCEHEFNQAEQCAYIIHYKGKCSVKDGTLSELEPICGALQEQGLRAKIE